MGNVMKSLHPWQVIFSFVWRENRTRMKRLFSIVELEGVAMRFIVSFASL